MAGFCHVWIPLTEALKGHQKSILIFLCMKDGLSLGILIQNVGASRRPVAYFSKQLDVVTQGWPVCLQTVAATCDLLQVVEKFTLGQPTSMLPPRCVLPVPEQIDIDYFGEAGQMPCHIT